jgi:hypothetical protein
MNMRGKNTNTLSTDSMMLDLSWKVYSHSTSHEISCLLRNPKVARQSQKRANESTILFGKLIELVPFCGRLSLNWFSTEYEAKCK